MTDRARAPRNPPVRAKMPLFAETRLSVTGGTLVLVSHSLAKGRLLVLRHCGMEARATCLHVRRLTVLSELATKARCQRPSFRTEVRALLSLPLLASHAGPPLFVAQVVELAVCASQRQKKNE